jgi:two-component sensor histidine kinase
LEGGGKVGALMRAHNWSHSPLGPPEMWPQSLRAIVALLLHSKFPMFVAWGKELGFLYNDPYAEILGAKHPRALGARFYDIWSEIWPDISPLIDAAMAGEATYREDLPLVMNRKGFDEQTWFTFSYSPVRDESGEIAGMFCAVSETTERKKAEDALRESNERLRALVEAAAQHEQHQQLLLNELNHRVKNTLAIVQSFALQTLRNAKSLDDGRETFNARLIALSKAHDVLTREQWQGARLQEVIVESLAAHLDGNAGDPRIRLAGPEIRLKPKAALALSMALHELATNAAKYGALSNAGGRVRLEWSSFDQTFRLIWVESGGPKVVAPAKRGFGSRLIEHGLSQDLDGRVHIAFEEAGVRCIIEAPLMEITD